MKSSLFFFKGRILNRFSKDISFLDDTLPVTLCKTLIVSVLPIQSFCDSFANLVQFGCTSISGMLTAVVANYWLAIALVIIVISFVTFSWYYLKTARDLKRIEATGMTVQ